MNPNLAIYAVHGAFWAAFGISRLWSMRLARADAPPPSAAPPATETQAIAPYSRTVLAIHSLAFGLMYFGVAQALISNRPTSLAQRIAGTLVIAAGAALASSALFAFRSWRFRAKLDKGHQLATGGPFRIVRHPIYTGLNLLALGTALWMPTVLTWCGFALMVIGSDLRARAEERLLEEAFGESYRRYRARTKRFIPGLY
jgi:protein-S-isoprenylcysteine O-methyltransferase Ste14